MEVYLEASLTPYLFLKIKLDKLVCMDGIGEDELDGAKIYHYNLRDKSVNVIERQYEQEPSKDEGELCDPNGYNEKDFYYDDDDKRYIYVFRKMLLKQTVVEDSQRNKLFHI